MSGHQPVIYKEGILLKRQRGLHTSNTRKLKFQERFCVLTNTSLDYYDPTPKKRSDVPKGQFAVEKMKIIEPMKDYIFGRDYPYAIQIGDQQEVMYFITESEASRDQWLEAFKLASKDTNVMLLPQCHHGVYGLMNKGRWSCCANQRRDTFGCSGATSLPKRKERTVTLPADLLLNDPVINTCVSANELPKPAPVTSRAGTDHSPLIRRFTTTNPLIKPNAQKFRKLRQSVDFDSEKLSELDEGDTPTKIIPSKDTLIVETESYERKGAGSPAPSEDSGRGTSVGNSRPNSQIEDNRIRSESVGKKPSQSVIPEQVSNSDHKSSQAKQDNVEGSAESSKTVTPVETPVRSKGEPLREDQVLEDKEKSVDFEKADEMEDVDAGRMVRARSTPPPGEAAARLKDPRPLSTGSFMEGVESGSLTGSGSERSIGETPQQRRVKESLSNSPRVRPRSYLATKSIAIGVSAYHPIHQACRDGNLEELENILAFNNHQSDLVDGPSNGEIPYTPLFIAFQNDHYQTMIQLLQHGANPNKPEPVQKASVLHWACSRGCLDIVDLLVKYKSDVNRKDSSGNTPLMAACKNGHYEIVEFLLQHGAQVNIESAIGHTSLHECSVEGHTEITELLLKVGQADPTVRDNNELSPYDIAFTNNNTEMMTMLQQATPEVLRPYSHLHTHTSPAGHMITSLAFRGNDSLVTGSRDAHVRFWDTASLAEQTQFRLTDTVLDLAIHESTHLVLGSTSIQIVDADNHENRRTVADDSNEDESLENPPLHLVKFGPKGRLVSASAEGNMVMLWPPVQPLNSGGIVTMPEAMFLVGDSTKEQVGCVYCLAMSPTLNCPWLAVGFQPGELFSPKGNKLVYIYNWETKSLKQIFDAGDGGLGVGVHVTFSPCGRFVAIGCAKNLCIWNPNSGDLMQKFTIEKDASIHSVGYSPRGSHLAIGLSTGEVQVFETTCSSSIFCLPRHHNSPVTTVGYSDNGKLFATGQKNGCIQLWEAFCSDGPISRSTEC